MSLSYNKPTWTDNTGAAINAARLQAISNVLDGLINQVGTKSVVGIIINGETMTMQYADGTIKQIENPTKGDKGDPGDDGFSPVITITTIEGGHHVVITDSNGEHEYDVLDGEKGESGDDGFSPILTETATATGYDITITDKEGTNTISLVNGSKGETGEAATITVGTTTTGETGTDAAVINSGTASAAVLDFTIPRGPKGDQGDTGDALTADSVKSGSITTVTIKNARTGAVITTFEVADGDTSIPIASTTELGGIKVGENLTITEDGTLNAESGGGTDVGLSVIDGKICITYES